MRQYRDDADRPDDEPEEGPVTSTRRIVVVAIVVIVFIGLSAFLVSAAAVGVFWLNRPVPQGLPVVADDSPVGEPNFSTDVDGLVQAYRAEVSADARYKGKVVRVSGVVDQSARDGGGFTVVLSNGRALGNRVFCHFAAGDRATVESLQAGSPVGVVGLCEGMRDGRQLWLSRCRVVPFD